MAGPCEPWDLDTACCVLPDGTDPDLIAKWQAVATDILYDASGRRYGPCEVTVRPCLRSCFGSWTGFADGGSAIPFPVLDVDGEWRNISTCGCRDSCSCGSLSEVLLDGPVASVVSVVVDGTELDAADYRLDRVGDSWRLLRTDGGTWPSCSDITAECGDPGSFCVTYMQGLAVPDLGTQAVSELTCELVKSCLPGCKECRLPKTVQSVTRRGVTITYNRAMPWLRQLPMVATFLDAVNPNNLTSSPTVFSPDVPATRTTIATSGS